MLGKSLVILSLFTVALFSWVLLGSLKQDNCINSNSIRNIIIFDGKSQKLIPHCNDLKFSNQQIDYNDIKIIKTVNSYSTHWFFSSQQTPNKFPIRKAGFKSNSSRQIDVLNQMLHYNFFRSKPINWIERSYLLFLKKLVLTESKTSPKFNEFLKNSSQCEGCQLKPIENLSDAPQAFYHSLALFLSEYLYENYMNSSLKQKIMFEYFIKRGDLVRSLKTINALITKKPFQQLNLVSQIKTIVTWMTFYSQNTTNTADLNLGLSHEILPTSYEFDTQLPLAWEDFVSIKNKKAKIRINAQKFDLVNGWIMNLHEKVSRQKQVFLFQCSYPKLKKAMHYLYNTSKLVYVKVCNIKQMLAVLKNLKDSKKDLDLAKLHLKYVEYNLSSLKIIEKKLSKNFLLKPQNLSAILYWKDLVQDPTTKIIQPKAAIDGVISFRN